VAPNAGLHRPYRSSGLSLFFFGFGSSHVVSYKPRSFKTMVRRSVLQGIAGLIRLIRD
jgi:hypothetical protein